MCGAGGGWLGRGKTGCGSCSGGGGSQSMLLCHPVVIPQELQAWEGGGERRRRGRVGVDGELQIYIRPDGAPFPPTPLYTSRSASMHLKIPPQSWIVLNSPPTPPTLPHL